jgi:hypothetical protein
MFAIGDDFNKTPRRARDSGPGGEQPYQRALPASNDR